MRYIVDERIGCVAVVDTLHPAYPSGNGLHFDYDEVVSFWSKMDENIRGSADQNRQTVEFAHRLCIRLNRDIPQITIDWRKTPSGLEGFVLGDRRVASVSDHGSYASGSINAPNFLYKQTLSRLGGGVTGTKEIVEWCEREWSRFICSVKSAATDSAPRAEGGRS